jgi:predicted outer membrane repeat protein
MHIRDCCVAVVLLAATTAASGATIHVDWSGEGDYLTIGEAVAAADSGDVVLVAPGTYRGSDNRDIDFYGKIMTVASDSGPEATVIDLEGAGRAFLFSSGETHSAIIDGFTIRNGHRENGGAAWIASAGPTFQNCVFEDNDADNGGAIYLGVAAWPYFENCTFARNSASFYGGAVYAYLTAWELTVDPYFIYSDFTENTAGVSGGAMSFKTGSVVRVTNCNFSHNLAPDGGAIYVGTFSGYGMDALRQTRIDFNWFEENESERGGAVFLNSFSWVLVRWGTFVRNSATEQGGAVFAQTDAEGSLTIQNCTLVGNHAEGGGGICAAGNSPDNGLTVTQSVIAFSTEGSSLLRPDNSDVLADLCCAFGNEGGNELFGSSRNIYTDPLFCGMNDDDYTLCSNSPCRGDNNEWGFLIGSQRTICGECSSALEPRTWGSIKALYR